MITILKLLLLLILKICPYRHSLGLCPSVSPLMPEILMASFTPSYSLTNKYILTLACVFSPLQLKSKNKTSYFFCRFLCRLFCMLSLPHVLITALTRFMWESISTTPSEREIITHLDWFTVHWLPVK